MGSIPDGCWAFILLFLSLNRVSLIRSTKGGATLLICLRKKYILSCTARGKTSITCTDLEKVENKKVPRTSVYLSQNHQISCTILAGLKLTHLEQRRPESTSFNGPSKTNLTEPLRHFLDVLQLIEQNLDLPPENFLQPEKIRYPS